MVLGGLWLFVSRNKRDNWSILVLNLARRKDRRRYCAHQYKEYPHQFVDAIDGRHLVGTPPAEESPLLPGEIGCYFSHVKALGLIVSQNLDYALVVEDDVVFSESFLPENIHNIVKEAPQGWMAIALGNNLTPMEKTYKRHSIGRLNHDLYGAYAIVYSRNGAKKVLANVPNRLTDPFDTWLGRTIPLHFVSPSVAFVHDVKDSDTLVAIIEHPYNTMTCEGFVSKYLKPNSNHLIQYGEGFVNLSCRINRLSMSVLKVLNAFDNQIGATSNLGSRPMLVDCFHHTDKADWDKMLVAASMTAMRHRYASVHTLLFGGSSRAFGIYLAFYTS